MHFNAASLAVTALLSALAPAAAAPSLVRRHDIPSSSAKFNVKVWSTNGTIDGTYLFPNPYNGLFTNSTGNTFGTQMPRELATFYLSHDDDNATDTKNTTLSMFELQANDYTTYCLNVIGGSGDPEENTSLEVASPNSFNENDDGPFVGSPCVHVTPTAHGSDVVLSLDSALTRTKWNSFVACEYYTDNYMIALKDYTNPRSDICHDVTLVATNIEGSLL